MCWSVKKFVQTSVEVAVHMTFDFGVRHFQCTIILFWSRHANFRYNILIENTLWLLIWSHHWWDEARRDRKQSMIGLVAGKPIANWKLSLRPWAYCQICKIAGCACAGNAGNVFPRRRFQRKPLVSDPGMHHGTCVTRVPWCMLGSLTCGDGKRSRHSRSMRTRNSAYLARGPYGHRPKSVIYRYCLVKRPPMMTSSEMHNDNRFSCLSQFDFGIHDSPWPWLLYESC